MTPRTGFKLYLLGGLSLLSLILAALAFFEVIATGNSRSVGLQYLFVGSVLGALFLYFGRFSKLRSQLDVSGRDITRSKQNLVHPVDSLGGRLVLVDEPIDLTDSREPNRARSGMLTPLVAAGIEPSVRWNIADEVVVAVKQHEGELIDRLIDEGLLTIEGPITERDVRGMVWVALSTIELTDNLLNRFGDQTWEEISLPARWSSRSELPK